MRMYGPGGRIVQCEHEFVSRKPGEVERDKGELMVDLGGPLWTRGTVRGPTKEPDRRCGGVSGRALCPNIL